MNWHLNSDAAGQEVREDPEANAGGREGRGPRIDQAGRPHMYAYPQRAGRAPTG
jgi:hypothetical protein